MKRTLLFVLALTAVGCAEGELEESASCVDLSVQSPLEDLRTCADQGYADAQFYLGGMYDNGVGVPEDYGVVRMEVDYEESPPTPQASIGGSCTIWLSNSTTSAGQYW